MLSFPLSLILLPYGIVVILFLLLAVYNVYNLVRYGATTNASFLATFCFLAGATFVLFFTWHALREVDWGQQIDLATPFIGEQSPTL